LASLAKRCACISSGVGGRALEVEQGVGQGFQLLKRQGLDLGGGGLAERAAAAAELAEFKP